MTARPSGRCGVAGGRFTKGAGQHPWERAAHEVSVQGFWIDRLEVTSTPFVRFVAATGHRLAPRGRPSRLDREFEEPTDTARQRVKQLVRLDGEVAALE